MDDRAGAGDAHREGTMRRVHVIVKGVVQGVGFRFFTQDRARQYELSGFARNRPDGTVEVEVEGQEKSVGAFLRELRVGPRSADVTGMEVEDKPAEGDFDGFRIRF
jgi:acylphosphatase